MLKSLSEFVYQEAGPDPVDRLDLIRYLGPSIFVAGGYDFNELRELETPDLGSEYISATWPEVPVINPLACITVRPFNPHGYTTFPYELVSQLAGHLRDLLSGAESVPDFDGVIRRAYIKAEHANDWKKAAEHWQRAKEPIEQSTESPRPLYRQRAQEKAVLAAIRDAGHDPMSLPKNEPGRPGIKSKVYAALKPDPMFTGSTVFDKTWLRLSGNGEIAYID